MEKKGKKKKKVITEYTYIKGVKLTKIYNTKKLAYKEKRRSI